MDDLVTEFNAEYRDEMIGEYKMFDVFDIIDTTSLSEHNAEIFDMILPITVFVVKGKYLVRDYMITFLKTNDVQYNFKLTSSTTYVVIKKKFRSRPYDLIPIGKDKYIAKKSNFRKYFRTPSTVTPKYHMVYDFDLSDDSDYY
jgi:hypothetical protein